MFSSTLLKKGGRASSHLLSRRCAATAMIRSAAMTNSATAMRFNSSSDYTPVDGDLFTQQQQQAATAAESSSSSSSAQSERIRKRRISMMGEISSSFADNAGGGAGDDANVITGVDDRGFPIMGKAKGGGSVPEAANKTRFSAKDGDDGVGFATATSSSAAGSSSSSDSSQQQQQHVISGWQSSPLVGMEESPIPGVYIIRINNSPVNTCTLEVLRGLLYCLYKLAATFENDVQDAAKPNPWVDRTGTAMLNRCRGIILHSSVLNIFSAGMDLEQLLTVGADAEAERLAAGTGAAAVGADAPSVAFDSTTHTPDGKRIPYASFVQYWGTLQHFQFTLCGFPVPAVAAISGDAPAGGCLMSMLCDYRVMAAKSARIAPNKTSPREFKIGMTSVKAGFAVPPWIAATLGYTVGPKFAEEILTQSKMVTAEEAKQKYGLIDQVSESDETVLLDALAAMEYLLANIPFQHTFWHVKESCRRPLLDMLETKEKRLDDVSNYIAHLSNPTVYGSLKSYKENLGAGKRKGAKPTQTSN